MFRPCHRIRTSMSLAQASSGARRRTSTISPFLSRETTFGAMHFAWKGKRIFFLDSNTSPSPALPARKHPRWLRCGFALPESGLWLAFSSLRCQNAAHRRAADLEPASNLGFGDASTIQFPDLSGLKSRRHRSTQPFAVLSGVGQASANSVPQNLPFELGEDCQQTGQRSTGRRR
jgi:hypothetical protein